MRILADHKVNGLNEALTITAMADPIHAGGACSHYMITLPDWTRSPDGANPHHVWDLNFQNKPITDSLDFNGLTNEALIAVVIDRLRSFQSGTFKCKENACALTHLEEGLMWLQQRTRLRMAAGVEGKLLPIPPIPPAVQNPPPPAAFVPPPPAPAKTPAKAVTKKATRAASKATPAAPVVPIDFTDPKLRAELAGSRPQTPARMADTSQDQPAKS